MAPNIEQRRVGPLSLFPLALAIFGVKLGKLATVTDTQDSEPLLQHQKPRDFGAAQSHDSSSAPRPQSPASPAASATMARSPTSANRFPPQVTSIPAEGTASILDLSPSHLIESSIPFFPITSGIVKSWLGIDLAKWVTWIFVVFGALKGLGYIWNTVSAILVAWLTCTITISSREPMHEDVIQWISTSVLNKSSKFSPGARRLNAIAASSLPSWSQMDGLSSDKSDGKSNAVVYEPSMEGTTWFFHGSWFWFVPRLIFFRQGEMSVGARRKRNQNDQDDQDGGFAALYAGKEKTIFLTCIGFSTLPLKELLEECRQSMLEAQGTMTAFQTVEEREYGEANWRRPNLRPTRPIATVELETSQKEALIRDIELYMHDKSRKFYADRGIPYRRGYLFSGPPGTGKTSMSFALAGMFGVKLYMLNLATFTGEKNLQSLFEKLPPKCIVLLEDIDSAGIKRENSNTVKREPKRPHPEDDMKALKRPITLSGLLNAIDGVTSPEGRVLIMTTNNPEALDPALVRPGRVDREVFFGNVTRETAVQIFKRMYDIPGAENEPGYKEEIAQKAEIFAEKVPEQVYTPADIQGYLLMKTDKPDAAVADFEAWSEHQLRLRKERQAVVENGPSPNDVRNVDYDDDEDDDDEDVDEFDYEGNAGEFDDNENADVAFARMFQERVKKSLFHRKKIEGAAVNGSAVRKGKAPAVEKARVSDIIEDEVGHYVAENVLYIDKANKFGEGPSHFQHERPRPIPREDPRPPFPPETPTVSRLSYEDAHGMRRLSAFWSYKPIGAAASEAARKKQRDSIDLALSAVSVGDEKMYETPVESKENDAATAAEEEEEEEEEEGEEGEEEEEEGAEEEEDDDGIF